MSPPWEALPAPTVTGGTGGSGTRAVAEVLDSAGIFIGSRLNEASDALDLALFDREWGRPFLESELAGTAPPAAEMYTGLEAAITAHLIKYAPPGRPWSWKHPHSYIVLPWLDTVFDGLRFIHLVRDGRRMAFSKNQKQPQRYGTAIFGEEAGQWEPHTLAIRFWSWANQRAADYGEQQMGDRYLRIRFEDLCSKPEESCTKILSFAKDGDLAGVDLEKAAKLVQAPPPPSLDPEIVRRLEDEGSSGLRRFGYI